MPSEIHPGADATMAPHGGSRDHPARDPLGYRRYHDMLDLVGRRRRLVFSTAVMAILLALLVLARMWS